MNNTIGVMSSGTNAAYNKQLIARVLRKGDALSGEADTNESKMYGDMMKRCRDFEVEHSKAEAENFYI